MRRDITNEKRGKKENYKWDEITVLKPNVAVDVEISPFFKWKKSLREVKKKSHLTLNYEVNW